ncbi:hypothetical protein GCM10010340_62660 [Streptomyces griseoloalbus]|nr:hypothetical protein GCM10010340_62660 [Streptomyces albaduncus]
MKYVAIVCGNQAKWDSFPAEAWPEAIAKQEAFNEKYRETGELVGAYGLADAANAQLVRRKDGVPAVTDGPYLETKEYIAGFHLLDCESEERAADRGGHALRRRGAGRAVAGPRPSSPHPRQDANLRHPLQESGGGTLPMTRASAGEPRGTETRAGYPS